jgi:hypothetical protein
MHGVTHNRTTGVVRSCSLGQRVGAPSCRTIFGTAEPPCPSTQNFAPAALSESITFVRRPVFRVFFFRKDEPGLAICFGNKNDGAML